MKVFIKFLLTILANHYNKDMSKNLEQLIEELENIDFCDIKNFDFFNDSYKLVDIFYREFTGRLDDSIIECTVEINKKIYQIISGKIKLENINIKKLNKNDLNIFEDALFENMRDQAVSIYELFATKHIIENFYGEEFFETKESPKRFPELRKWFFEKSNNISLDDYGIFGIRAIKNNDKMIYYILNPSEEIFGVVFKEYDEKEFNDMLIDFRKYKLKKLLK